MWRYSETYCCQFFFFFCSGLRDTLLCWNSAMDNFKGLAEKCGEHWLLWMCDYRAGWYIEWICTIFVQIVKWNIEGLKYNFICLSTSVRWFLFFWVFVVSLYLEISIWGFNIEINLMKTEECLVSCYLDSLISSADGRQFLVMLFYFFQPWWIVNLLKSTTLLYNMADREAGYTIKKGLSLYHLIVLEHNVVCLLLILWMSLRVE